MPTTTDNLPRAKGLSRFFAERHAPDTVVLLGKGPSLDGYDGSCNPEGVYVLALNEVPLVKRCDGAIYSDPQFDFIEYPEPIDIFRPRRADTRHGGRGYTFGFYAPGAKRPPRDVDDCLPLWGAGTSTRALTLCGRWGVRRVILWGFDAYKGACKIAATRYAQCLKGYGPEQPWPGHYNNSINDGIRTAIEHYELIVEFGDNGQLRNK